MRRTPVNSLIIFFLLSFAMVDVSVGNQNIKPVGNKNKKTEGSQLYKPEAQSIKSDKNSSRRPDQQKHVSSSSKTQQAARVTKEDHVQLLAYVLNTGVHNDRGENQEATLRRPENFSFGARYGRISAYVESSHFRENSGQGNLNIERTHQSYLLWGTYDFLQWKYVALSAGLGAGTYSDVVTTKFMSEQRNDGSNYQWNSGANLGAEMKWEWLSFKLEGQMLYGKNQDPNPTWAAFARFGFIIF